MIILGIFNLYFLLEITPQSNDECLWVNNRVSKDKVGIFFDLVKEGGVTWEAGIRDGDQLIAINGVEIRNQLTAQYLLNQVAGGDSAYYVYRSEGKEYESYVEVKKLVNFTGLAVAIASMLWLIVGFIVIKSKPEGKLQLLFFKIGIYFVLFSTFGLINNNFNSNPIYDYYWVVLFFVAVQLYASCYLPFFIVRFFWLFPKPLPILNYKYTKQIFTYAPRVLFALSVLIILISNTSILNKLFFTLNAILVNGLLYLFLASIGIGFVSLITSYFRLPKGKERKPIFVILVSYTIAVVAIIYSSTLANQLAQSIFNEPEYFFPVLLAALLPLSFGYSIFKYSLMDVGDVIKNAVFYGVLTVSLAAAYFLVIYILGLGISSAISTEYQGIIAGFIFVFFAVLFQSTKDKFQEYITEKFYPEQFAYQKILLKFSSEVPTVVGMENILNFTQNIFIDSLKIKKYAVYLTDNKDECLKLMRSYGTFVIPQRFKDNSDLILSMINVKQTKKLLPVIEQEEFVTVFPEINEKLIEDKIYTVIPLEINSKLIGLLLFGVKYSGARFAGKDLELLNAAANQISVSLENARLYESEAERMKIERDLENARKIQESLLPRFIPKFKNLDVSGSMIPAMQVGGDYYDVIKVSENKLFVIIGDVSGKGFSASFYMSKLQTMMRLYCNDEISPKEVLSKVNKIIYNSIERNWFITVAIGLFDLDKKELRYCRAGHPPLIELNNTSLIHHKSNGLGVGLESGEIFDDSLEEEIIPLKDNYNYIFYSDGITEAMNEKEEMYGINRFERFVIQNSQKDASVILESTIADITNFTSSAHQHDDITLVVVKYS